MYVCLCVCTCTYVCLRVEGRSQCWVSSLIASLCYDIHPARIAGQKTLRVLLSLSSQDQKFRSSPNVNMFSFLTWFLGIQNQVLMPVQQAFHQLSHFPNPMNTSFCFPFPGLRLELRTLCMLGKCSTTELRLHCHNLHYSILLY